MRYGSGLDLLPCPVLPLCVLARIRLINGETLHMVVHELLPLGESLLVQSCKVDFDWLGCS